MLAAGSEIGQGKVPFLEPELRTAQAATGDQRSSTAQGRELWSSQPAPRLVLARSLTSLVIELDQASQHEVPHYWTATRRTFRPPCTFPCVRIGAAFSNPIRESRQGRSENSPPFPTVGTPITLCS